MVHDLLRGVPEGILWATQPAWSHLRLLVYVRGPVILIVGVLAVLAVRSSGRRRAMAEARRDLSEANPVADPAAPPPLGDLDPAASAGTGQPPAFAAWAPAPPPALLPRGATNGAPRTVVVSSSRNGRHRFQDEAPPGPPELPQSNANGKATHQGRQEARRARKAAPELSMAPYGRPVPLPEAPPRRRGRPISPARTLRRFLKPYRFRLALASVMSVLETALEVLRPWPLALAVDYAIGGKKLQGWLAPLRHLSPGQLAGVAALGLLGIVVVGGLMKYGIECLIGSASERIGADIRVAAFGKLTALSLRFHDRNRTGDLVTRLTSDVSRVQDATVAWFETLVPEGLSLLGMMGVLFLIDRELGAAALVVIPILTLLGVVSRRRIREVQRQTRTLFGTMASRANESLRNVRVVQAFARGLHEQRRFRSASDDAADSAVEAVEVMARFAPLTESVLAAGSGLVLFVGVLRVIDHRLSVGTLLVVLTYVTGMYGPIGALTRMVSMMAKGMASRERLAEILTCDEVVDEKPNPAEMPAGMLGLSVDGVSFAYRDGTPAVSELTFQVLPGEVACVVGASGAGKSTLLSLLLRLYDPDAGTIRVNGQDLRNIRLAGLRDRLSLVPQDPWILDGTIEDNIIFGQPNATPGDVRRAAALALVDEFVDRMPEGYATEVGEGGGQLSGGQRRRLALARAIVRECSLLLLDEPTNGLDAESEATVMAALRRAIEGRTAIIVSHALSVAAVSDWVIVLDGGRVAEQGRPCDLLEAGGAFARLWAFQGLPDVASIVARSDALAPKRSGGFGRRRSGAMAS